MSVTTLYKRIFIVSLIIGILLAALQFGNLLGNDPAFVWICWGFFSLITPFVLGLAAMSNKTSTAGKAVYVVLGAMALKFVFCLLMILLYILVANPETPRFILPFFPFYIIYGIIETQYLLEMVKHDNPTIKPKDTTK